MTRPGEAQLGAVALRPSFQVCFLLRLVSFSRQRGPRVGTLFPTGTLSTCSLYWPAKKHPVTEIFPSHPVYVECRAHTALFLGRARIPQHYNSSRKSVLSSPTCHANLPQCPRLSCKDKPTLLCIPSTNSYGNTPYLQEKVGLRSCCNQSTVLPLTLQGFRSS